MQDQVDPFESLQRLGAEQTVCVGDDADASPCRWLSEWLHEAIREESPKAFDRYFELENSFIGCMAVPGDSWNATQARHMLAAARAKIHAIIALDARSTELKAALSLAPAPDPVRFHPAMAKTYRARVGQLIRGLSDADGQEEAREALRALVEKIVLVPVETEDGGTRLAIDLHGALASLLRLATGQPVHAVTRTQKAPRKAGREWAKQCRLVGGGWFFAETGCGGRI